jgi:hypothetical protein
MKYYEIIGEHSGAVIGVTDDPIKSMEPNATFGLISKSRYLDYLSSDSDWGDPISEKRFKLIPSYSLEQITP